MFFSYLVQNSMAAPKQSVLPITFKDEKLHHCWQFPFNPRYLQIVKIACFSDWSLKGYRLYVFQPNSVTSSKMNFFKISQESKLIDFWHFCYCNRMIKTQSLCIKRVLVNIWWMVDLKTTFSSFWHKNYEIDKIVSFRT